MKPINRSPVSPPPPPPTVLSRIQFRVDRAKEAGTSVTPPFDQPSSSQSRDKNLEEVVARFLKNTRDVSTIPEEPRKIFQRIKDKKYDPLDRCGDPFNQHRVDLVLKVSAPSPSTPFTHSFVQLFCYSWFLAHAYSYVQSCQSPVSCVGFQASGILPIAPGPTCSKDALLSTPPHSLKLMEVKKEEGSKR
ncbi:hypothetical protein LWI28_014275 [Acer negundo]|uniref:Uncharacterized protein n=1 Tax=Acer negundo TaxID=4023 RepID=A0AAD5NFF7_ACENE|nr:hypothetical protein LWI28_014275 [Acer negundo]